MSDAEPDPTRVERVVDPTQVNVPVQGGGPPYDEPPARYGPPGDPPPDRRPWIIAAVLGAIIVVLVLILLLQSDDEDGDDASSTSTTELTTTSSSTSTTAGSTTTSAAPTTTEAPAVTIPPEECAELGEGPATPALAANAVYDAWVRGDTACAAVLMTGPALAELFNRDGTGATDEFQQCTEEDLPDPHTDCAFTYEGGVTHYLMNYSATDGWQVYDIEQVAD